MRFSGLLIMALEGEGSNCLISITQTVGQKFSKNNTYLGIKRNK